MTVRKLERPPAANSQPVAAMLRDLRGPIRVVRGQAKRILAAPAPLTDDQRQSLQAIDRQTERMEFILDACEQGALAQREANPSREVLEAMPAHPAVEMPRVLIVEDDSEISGMLRQLLEERHEVTLAKDGGAALALLQREPFDLAILDVQLPVLDGFVLIERLKETAGLSPLPAFMYLTARSSAEEKVRGLALGAIDYVTKPFDADELVARVDRIIAGVAREQRLRVDALTDALTGLANYRSLAETLEREFARARRYDHDLCLLTVDLDRLKAINDESGHEAGNAAIRLVAQSLKDGVRSFEFVARQGGDEFGILLPNTSKEAARQIAERLRASIALHRIQGRALSISVGIGVRERGSDLTLRQLVEESDSALYRAKRAGRDRIA